MQHQKHTKKSKHITLPKNSNLYLKTPNGCDIILKSSMLGEELCLFVRTNNSSANTKGFFDFYIKNQNTRSSCDEKEGFLKRQGSRNTMANVLGAANYLAQLFIKCDGKYGCTKTKIEKLLSIANFTYMKNGDVLFDENVCIRDCGVGIRFDFPAHLCGDIVIASSNNEECNPILESEINGDITFNSQYNIDVQLLTDKDKNVLHSVFLKFGNCDSKKIGEKIDEFKANLSRTDTVGEPILVEKCKQFFSSDCDTNNEIIKFILEM